MINNIPTILSDNTDRNRAKEEIINSPIYKNLIVSENGKTTALQINLKQNKELFELSKTKASLISKKINNEISQSELLLTELQATRQWDLNANCFAF